VWYLGAKIIDISETRRPYTFGECLDYHLFGNRVCLEERADKFLHCVVLNY
jgi:hypothetical protein